MNKAFKYLSKYKNDAVRGELGRAHLMIALLSLVLIVWMSLGQNSVLVFNRPLTIIAVILLVIVLVTSTTLSFTLLWRKK